MDNDSSKIDVSQILFEGQAKGKGAQGRTPELRRLATNV